jgi:hypothetical protein
MASTAGPPTPSPVHINVAALVVPPAVFYGLALFTFTLRIIARWRATGLQLDDAFISLAMVSTPLAQEQELNRWLIQVSAFGHSYVGILCIIRPLWAGQADTVTRNTTKIDECTHVDSKS